MDAFRTGLGVMPNAVVFGGRGERRAERWGGQAVGLGWLGIRRRLLSVPRSVVFVGRFGVFDEVGDVVEVVVAECV